MAFYIFKGSCLDILPKLPENLAHCCVTSPPYWNQRDYGVEGQLGLEDTPEKYVEDMVSVFRGVKRVLRPDGVLWLNIGDSYVTNKKAGLPGKNLLGIPWRVAFALQKDGWFLRSDVIWYKNDAKPENIDDRPYKGHEYFFMFSKSESYYFDIYAKGYHEEHKTKIALQTAKKLFEDDEDKTKLPEGASYENMLGRNRQTVWPITKGSFKYEHFAPYPEELITPAIAASTSEKGCCAYCGKPWIRKIERQELNRKNPKFAAMEKGGATATTAGLAVLTKVGFRRKFHTDWIPSCGCPTHDPIPCTVLDPFNGSGTTGLVSARLGLSYYGCELSQEHINFSKKRIHDAGFNMFGV